MERIHISHKPIKRFLQKKFKSSYITDSGSKPLGFWYGIGNSWVEWCKSEMPHWIGEYKYKLELKNSNILKLNSVKEILLFNGEYGFCPDGIANFTQINWKKVSEDFSGIEIAPYQWDLRFDHRVNWYYGWDVASGCIWNFKGVKLKQIT